jgi:uncharacterized protein YcbK (DUF882 family)
MTESERRLPVSICCGRPDNSPMIKRTTSVSALLAFLLLPAALGASGDARSLSFYHTHTGDSLEVTYFEQGEYRAEGMAQLRTFLADWRNGREQDMDPALMDILWKIQLRGRHRETYEVISAYRSPETNDLLRSRSSGVARNSQHVPGKAIDVRLRGMETSKLRDLALELQLGGVGYYRQSDFVHVDTGRVRRW